VLGVGAHAVTSLRVAPSGTTALNRMACSITTYPQSTG
jgi:hypothetical protein